jgi:hypothetical protein
MQLCTVDQVLNTAVPAVPTTNSIYNLASVASGTLISKVITLGGTGAQTVNIFQLTGSCYLKRLYGFITTKTTLTNLTASSFQLFDGAAVQITANTGVLSGMAVGTMIAKTGLLGVVYSVANNVAGIVNEATANVLWCECAITQKVATATYVRLAFSTTDNPINATMTMYAAYVPLNSGSTLVAV